MTADASFSICATCAVEHAGRPEGCAICADERQWVPAGGQRWTTLGELAAAGHRTVVTELEPGLLGIEASPAVGMAQSGWPTFSPNVKKRSCSRMSATENDTSSVARPRS